MSMHLNILLAALLAIVVSVAMRSCNQPALADGLPQDRAARQQERQAAAVYENMPDAERARGIVYEPEGGEK